MADTAHMTEREYRTHPAISRSDLWTMRDNPERFHYLKEHPADETAPALIFGQAAHKLLLEPNTFFDEFEVAPEIDRRTKAGKEAWTDFLKEAEGKTVITKADFDVAKEMAKKAMSYPEIVNLLNGEHEKPYFWTDAETGEECKCRVDCISFDGKTVVDYKTTHNASTMSFMSSIERYGYDFQSAMYLIGTGAERFVFIAQEKDPPYSVNIISATPDMIETGNRIYRNLLNVYHYCKTTGDWYGYLGGPKEEAKEELTDKLPWEE